MHPNYYTTFLVLLICLVSNSSMRGQNMRGDTIFLEENKVVTVYFPAIPDKAELAGSESQEGSYKVSTMGNKSISILALKNGAENQDLEVTEGDRNHLFILSYKSGSPARSIDFSTRRKLSKRISIVKKNISQALNFANVLYNGARNNLSDLGLWQKVEERYFGLSKVVEAKDEENVKSRIEESQRRQKDIIDETKYKAAMKDGQTYYSSSNFEQARSSYLTALQYKPGDVLALRNLNLNDSSWAKMFIDKGDEDYKRKRFIEAKANYQEALILKPDYPSLQDKFEKAKEAANPSIYATQKKKGDAAMEAFEIEEARRAYDSALSAIPNDKEVLKKLINLKGIEQELQKEEQKEAEYQGILAKAKSMGDTASNANEYDLAIKEYKRALAIFKTRKFPTKKMKELSKIKNAIRVNRK